MHRFNVPDMTCGHCVNTITRALKALDPAAQVDIELSSHVVEVRSALAREEIERAIAEAGYTPT